MDLALRARVLGSRADRGRALLTAVVIGVATFVAYATGFFAVAGGLVVIPGEATFVGLMVALGAGYGDEPLLAAWVGPFAAYLGFSAEWAFLGLSPANTLVDRLAFLFDPTGFTVFAVAALVLGTVAFAAGSGLRAGVDRFRARLPSVE